MPTVRFQILYVFLVLARDRRRIVHVNVTGHPTAEWTASNSGMPFPGATCPAISSTIVTPSSARRSARSGVSLTRRTVQPPELGRVVAIPHPGGLQHRYERRAA